MAGEGYAASGSHTAECSRLAEAIVTGHCQNRCSQSGSVHFSSGHHHHPAKLSSVPRRGRRGEPAIQPSGRGTPETFGGYAALPGMSGRNMGRGDLQRPEAGRGRGHHLFIPAPARPLDSPRVQVTAIPHRVTRAEMLTKLAFLDHLVVAPGDDFSQLFALDYDRAVTPMGADRPGTRRVDRKVTLRKRFPEYRLRGQVCAVPSRGGFQPCHRSHASPAPFAARTI